MNFFRKKTSWSYLELGVVKVCLLSEGILVGIYLTDFFSTYRPLLWALFGTGLLLWMAKINRSS